LAGSLSASPARGLAARWHDHLLQGRRRSPHTVRAYTATAHRLLDFLEQHLADAVDASALARLTPADLRAFLAARRAAGLGNASAARELSAVRAFLGFAAEEGASKARSPC
jgi:integrase/recombinase XerC